MKQKLTQQNIQLLLHYYICVENISPLKSYEDKDSLVPLSALPPNI